MVHAGVRGPQQDLIAQAKFFDQLHHMAVIGEPVMIKLLQLDSANLETAGKAAHFGLGLQHRHGQSPRAQLQRRRQPGKAATDNHNL